VKLNSYIFIISFTLLFLVSFVLEAQELKVGTVISSGRTGKQQMWLYR
jgi:hypothetical protein